MNAELFKKVKKKTANCFFNKHEIRVKFDIFGPLFNDGKFVYF